MNGFSLLAPFSIQDANILYSNISENEYPVYVAGTYGLGQRCLLIAANQHYVYESKISSNTIAPDITQKETTNWLRVSSTNKYKIFDQSITSQTQNADLIEYTLTGLGRFNTQYFANLSASNIEITVKDNANSIIYNQIFNLVPSISISSWWHYFYETRNRARELTVDGLPLNANSTLNIKIKDNNSIVKCGILLIGITENFGFSQYGAKFGIDDYSVKETNIYGDISITERAYNKHINLTVEVEKSKEDALANRLSDYRAKFVLYRGVSNRPSLTAYGKFQNFEGVISYPLHTIFTIDIQGIT